MTGAPPQRTVGPLRSCSGCALFQLGEQRVGQRAGDALAFAASRASAVARRRPERRAPRRPTAATSAARTPPPPRPAGWGWPSPMGAAGRRWYGGRGAERGARERQRVGRSRGLARWQAPKPARRRPSAPGTCAGGRHGLGPQPAAKRARPRPAGKARRPQNLRRGAVLCVSLARGPLRGESPVRLTDRLGDAIHALKLQQLARVELGDRDARRRSARSARRWRVRRYRRLAQWRACVLRRRPPCARTGRGLSGGGRRRNVRLHGVRGPVGLGRRRVRLRDGSLPGRAITLHRSPTAPRHPREPRALRWPSSRARPRPR